MAWIEEDTGRILQTELEVGRGRRDRRWSRSSGSMKSLQVTVPVEMRTQNPDGVAKYSERPAIRRGNGHRQSPCLPRLRSLSVS